VLSLNINSEAADDGNNSNSMLDNSPFIKIISPTNGSLVHEIFTVEGIASDEPPNSTVYVRVDDRTHQEVQLEYGTKWNSTIVLSNIAEGWVTLEAERRHHGVGSVYNTIKIFINKSYSPSNKKPIIYVESPLENDSILYYLDIIGNTQDDSELITTYISSMGYGWVLLSMNQTWTRSSNILWMTPGRHQIAFVAFDGERASHVVYINFTKEPYIPPRIIIKRPLSNQSFTDGINISGLVTNGIPPISVVEIRVNDGTWISAIGTKDWYYYLSDEGLPFGEILIEVRAKDHIQEESDIVVISAYHISNEFTVRNNNPIHYWILVVLIIIILLLIARRKISRNESF
jgi:hypothetical protein